MTPLRTEPGEPLPARDFGLVLGLLDDLHAGRPRSVADAGEAIEAFERIKRKYQGWLAACLRVTEQVNKDADGAVHTVASAARRYRKALGEAYLGGPLA